MKVLKNYLKVIFCFLALAICSVMFAYAPGLTASALSYAKSSYDVAVSSVRMPKTVEANEEFRIPLLKSSLGVAEYTVRVTDPTGSVHNYNVGGTNAEGFFKENTVTVDSTEYVVVNVKNSGNYKVQYVINEM